MDAVLNDLSLLTEEYESYVYDAKDGGGNTDWDRMKNELMATGGWTDSAAEHLIQLVRDYGSFMLRNAAALALATRVEDGEFGY